MQRHVRFLSRLLIAVWFVGMVALGVWNTPAQGQGVEQKYFPLTLRHAPLIGEPDLHQYFGLLAYGAQDNAEIYTIRADGSELTRLTYNEFHDTSPQLSSDGTRIAFLHGTQPYRYFEGARPYKVMVMNRDGSNLHPVVDEALGASQLFAWSPTNGDMVVIVQSSFDTNWDANDMLLVSAEGAVTTIAENIEFSFSYTSSLGWSPDGRYVTYLLPTPYGTLTAWLYSVTAGTKTVIGENVQSVNWVPTGNALLVQESDAVLGDVTRLVGLDGNAIRTLFTNPYQFTAWVGTGPAFLAWSRSEHILYRGNITTSALTPIYDPARVGFVSVSPRGDQFVFQAYNDGYSLLPLYVHSLRDDTVQTVESEQCIGIAGYPYRISDASWSRDGTGLLLVGQNNNDRLPSYRRCFIDLRSDPLQSVAVNAYYEGVSYLPYSSKWAVGYTYEGYPPPDYLTPSIIETRSHPVATPLFELEFVVSYEWRYLP